MNDIVTPERRSTLMGRIRGKDTRPEMFVRRALHAKGYRFRIHVPDLPGKPDLVFSKRRAAIFIHGCFWHRHGCSRTYMPKTNVTFWQTKFTANVKRDRRHEEALVSAGWRVLIVWECAVTRDGAFLGPIVAFLDPPRVVKRI